MWNYNEEFTPEQNRENAVKIKSGLEDMRYAMDGIVSLQVLIEPLKSSSNADIVLCAVFEDMDAYETYKMHPIHVRLREFIYEYLDRRMCFDCIEKDLEQV